MWKPFSMFIFVVIFAGPAGAQTEFRASVLEIESHVARNSDLMVTVRNMSKLVSTLDSVTAELSPECPYQTSVGTLSPGDVRTVRLATKSQIVSCKAPTLKAFKSGEKVRPIFIPREQPLIIDRRLRPVPVLPGSQSLAGGRALPSEAADSHVFKIRAAGNTKGESFAVDGNWVLRVER